MFSLLNKNKNLKIFQHVFLQKPLIFFHKKFIKLFFHTFSQILIP